MNAPFNNFHLSTTNISEGKEGKFVLGVKTDETKVTNSFSSIQLIIILKLFKHSNPRMSGRGGG